ncbi:OB-fold nucleic acid binding domain-containing protein [Candidatus Woesearchaeota archaeon]|nr:OB-fold nucleic acid binding domain-containing protein [Candidatus Woesearchaeota archaeon]
MENKTLITLCLIINIIGTIILIIATDSTLPETTKKLLTSDIDKFKTIEGEITSIRETPGTYKIILNNIDVTVFKTKKLNLKKGDLIKVVGKVQENKNKLEIIANKILTLK